MRFQLADFRLSTSVAMPMLLLCAVLVLNACQTMSKAECSVADWNDTGIKDGRAGFPTSRLDGHAKACNRIDVLPDKEAYLAGHAIGIAEFCTPRNGLNFGRNGGFYGNSCPAALEPAFVQAYRAGFNLKQAEDRVNQKEASIERITNAAFASETTDEQRAELRLDLAEARLDLQRLILERQQAQQAYDFASASII